MTLNVNISGLELAAPGYVEGVNDVLNETDWPPGQLVLELPVVAEGVEDEDRAAILATLAAAPTT